MSLITRKSFLKYLAGSMALAALPVPGFAAGAKAGEVILHRKIMSKVTPHRFVQGHFFSTRKNWLEEQSFNSMTSAMISSKSIVAIERKRTKEALEVSIRFRSYKEYARYSRMLNRMMSKSNFENSQYVFIDTLVYA